MKQVMVFMVDEFTKLLSLTKSPTTATSTKTPSAGATRGTSCGSSIKTSLTAVHSNTDALSRQ
jgi:hypothetical protein